MTAHLTLEQWAPVLDTEYLQGFIRSGGAAVKFAVPLDDQRRPATIEHLSRLATDNHYLAATVDSAETRIHMMDQLFFEVARQLPWTDLTTKVLAELARRDGYIVPDQIEGPFIDALAEANDMEPDFLRNEIRRKVSQVVFKRRALAKDFRVAMTQLCLAVLAGGTEQDTITEVMTGWLTGEIKTVGAIKPYNVYSKINRTNARFILESTLDWIRFAGYAGLVVTLDAGRLTIGRNPRDGKVNYTKAGRLDAYELLRQFIDAIDRMIGFLLIVVPSDAFLDDSLSGHGIGEYQALYWRVYDEIRDTHLANPMAALVRLGPPTEEIAR